MYAFWVVYLILEEMLRSVNVYKDIFLWKHVEYMTNNCTRYSNNKKKRWRWIFI
jgi:hypothetical protein